MITRAENWTIFYSTLDSNHEVNQKMIQVMGFTKFQTSCAEGISNLVNNPGLSLS